MAKVEKEMEDLEDCKKQLAESKERLKKLMEEQEAQEKERLEQEALKPQEQPLKLQEQGMESHEEAPDGMMAIGFHKQKTIGFHRQKTIAEKHRELDHLLESVDSSGMMKVLRQQVRATKDTKGVLECIDKKIKEFGRSSALSNELGARFAALTKARKKLFMEYDPERQKKIRYFTRCLPRVPSNG